MRIQIQKVIEYESGFETLMLTILYHFLYSIKKIHKLLLFQSVFMFGSYQATSFLSVSVRYKWDSEKSSWVDTAGGEAVPPSSMRYRYRYPSMKHSIVGQSCGSGFGFKWDRYSLCLWIQIRILTILMQNIKKDPN